MKYVCVMGVGELKKEEGEGGDVCVCTVAKRSQSRWMDGRLQRLEKVLVLVLVVVVISDEM